MIEKILWIHLECTDMKLGRNCLRSRNRNSNISGFKKRKTKQKQKTIDTNKRCGQNLFFKIKHYDTVLFYFRKFWIRHLPFLPLECPDDQYGRNCLQTCSENCHVSKTCDKKTGGCHGGCIEGWKLPQCNKGT